MHQPAPRMFAGVLTRGAALTAWAFLFGATVSAAPVAVFSGDGLEMVIDDAGPDGRALRGSLLHLGERYPFTATTQSDFARSEGSFQVGSHAFSFLLLPTGTADRLQLVTADAQQNNEVFYDLRLQEAAPAAAPAPTPAPTPEPAPTASAPAEHDDPSAGHTTLDAAPFAEAPRAAPAPAPPAPAVAGPVGLTLRGPQGGGWEVTAVDPGSRAELAGFAPGDMITQARAASGADVPLPDRPAVVAALTTPGTLLTTARAGRADHTVVLYPGAPSTSRAPSQPPAEVNQSLSEPAAAAPIAEPAPAPTAALTLMPTTVTDTAGTGLASHTLLLPEGWTLDAGVLWTPAVEAAFVNLSARATSPGGAHQVTWLPDGAFTDAADAGTAIGSVQDGKVHFPQAASPAAFVQASVLPGFRPGATGVQVLSDGVLPGVADAWERHHETFLTAQKKRAAALHAKRTGGTVSPATAVVTAPQVRLRFEEDGVAYDEQFTFVHLLLTTHGSGAPTHDWYVFAVNALRAPAGQLDAATPGLRSVAESLRPTQQWQATIEALTPELTRAQPPLTAAQVAKHVRPRADELDALVTANTRGWSALRAARVARLEAFVEAEPALRIATTADGTARGLLPNGVRALVNPQGAVVLTGDAPAADAARPGGPWAVLK